jgi:ParB-like chromosome segregation protein Spo0J
MIEHNQSAAMDTSDEEDVHVRLLGAVDRLPEVNTPIASLVPGFHLRATGVDAAHAQMLADVAASAGLPPILVQKEGARVIDGMHRIEAARLRGAWSIKARIIDCTDKEALVLAIRSNTLHGLPLSRADRICGAKRILAAHPDWSDRAVAEVSGLSAKSVASLRSGSDVQLRQWKRLGRDGRRRPLVPGEGRRRAAEYIAAHPEASVRQIASEVDVSVGTAQKVRESLRSVPQRPPGGDGQVRPIASAPRSRPARLHTLAWAVVAPKLTGDPAVRYSEGGRAFLRWMGLHSTQADEWREFVDAIPAHWLDDVRWIALTMSNEWRQFAEWIESRQKLEA